MYEWNKQVPNLFFFWFMLLGPFLFNEVHEFRAHSFLILTDIYIHDTVTASKASNILRCYYSEKFPNATAHVHPQVTTDLISIDKDKLYLS